MKRDMELCRKILFQIEKEYVDTALINLKIEGYTTEEVAYHCNLLYEAGFISDYDAQYADDQIYYFQVGDLTWEGQDFLDKIRDDTKWHKIMKVIKNDGLSMTFNTISDVASAIIASMTEGAVRGLINH